MIRVSAPGKTILMGEHAAVYGRPALVASLDRRVHVSIDTDPPGVESGTVDLDLPQLGVRRVEPWADLRACAGHQTLAGADRSLFVRIAVGKALEAAGLVPGELAARIHVASEFPVGSGFGSSAAIAVAVVRAIFALAKRPVDDDELQAVSLDVERVQHGSPSGIDNATAIAGGLVWVERRDSGLCVTPLAESAVESPILRHLRVVQTGEPAESTGEVVASVRRLREREPAAFEERLEVMESSTRTLRELIETGGDVHGALSEIRRFEACLETIGVVPEPVRERVRRIEQLGGAAKISGAGSVDGPGAGSLLVLHPAPQVLDASDALDGTERLDVRLGGEGVRIDEIQGK